MTKHTENEMYEVFNRDTGRLVARMSKSELATEGFKSDNYIIKEWAKTLDKELRKTIQFHINEGVDKNKAVDMVLDASAIGEKYKSKIRYDFQYNSLGGGGNNRKGA